MKIKKLIITITLSSICAFASSNLQSDFNKISLGKKVPSEVKGSWSEVKDGNINMYNKKTKDNDRYTLDERNGKLSSKHFDIQANGSFKKPFKGMQGKVSDSHTYIYYGNSALEQTMLTISDKVSTEGEANLMYQLGIDQGKDLAKKFKYVKVESSLITDSKRTTKMKVVKSIYLGENNLKSSQSYSEALK